jgi:hypothetical protein
MNEPPTRATAARQAGPAHSLTEELSKLCHGRGLALRVGADVSKLCQPWPRGWHDFFFFVGGIVIG